jgi:hypothetical protein
MGGFTQDRGKLHGQPDLGIVEERSGMGASQFCEAVWRGASGLLLDGIELRDPADGLFGDGGRLRPVDFDELAPDMGHAGNLADGSGAIEILKPGIAIGMHPAAESDEMILGVLHLRSPENRYHAAGGASPPPGRSSRA